MIIYIFYNIIIKAQQCPVQTTPIIFMYIHNNNNDSSRSFLEIVYFIK